MIRAVSTAWTGHSLACRCLAVEAKLREAQPVALRKPTSPQAIKDIEKKIKEIHLRGNRGGRHHPGSQIPTVINPSACQ